MHLAELDRVAERADDVLLADHLVEGAWAVAAVEREHRKDHRSRGSDVRTECDPPRVFSPPAVAVAASLAVLMTGCGELTIDSGKAEGLARKVAGTGKRKL